MQLEITSKKIRKIREGEFQKKIPVEIQHLVRRKIRILENIQSVSDFESLPFIINQSSKKKETGSFVIKLPNNWRLH